MRPKFARGVKTKHTIKCCQYCRANIRSKKDRAAIVAVDKSSLSNNSEFVTFSLNKKKRWELLDKSDKALRNVGLRKPVCEKHENYDLHVHSVAYWGYHFPLVQKRDLYKQTKKKKETENDKKKDIDDNDENDVEVHVFLTANKKHIFQHGFSCPPQSKCEKLRRTKKGINRRQKKIKNLDFCYENAQTIRRKGVVY